MLNGHKGLVPDNFVELLPPPQPVTQPPPPSQAASPPKQAPAKPPLPKEVCWGTLGGWCVNKPPFTGDSIIVTVCSFGSRLNHTKTVGWSVGPTPGSN